MKKTADFFDDIEDTREAMDSFKIEGRRIWIQGEIKPNILDVAAKIIEFNKEDHDVIPSHREPISIILSSPGGITPESNVLIDVIDISETPIITVAAGTCASNAARILIHGHQRLALPNSDILFHHGYMSCPTISLEKYYSHAKYDMGCEEKFIRELKDFTNIPDDVLEKYLDRDLCIDAFQAKEWNIIDDLANDITDMF